MSNTKAVSRAESPVNINIQDLSQQLILSLLNTSSMKISPFTGFDENVDIIKWLEDFEDIAEAQGWVNEVKMKKFPLYLRGVAKEFHKLYVKDSSTPPSSWNELKTLFIESFIRIDYLTHLRQQLRTKKQGLNQRVALYICEMQSLCMKVNSNMEQDEVVDYVVDGLSGPVKERVLMLKPKSLKDLIEKANSVEYSLLTFQENREKTTVMSVVPSYEELYMGTSGWLGDKRIQESKKLTNTLKSVTSQDKIRPRNSTFGPGDGTHDVRPVKQCFSCKKWGHVKNDNRATDQIHQRVIRRMGGRGGNEYILPQNRTIITEDTKKVSVVGHLEENDTGIVLDDYVQQDNKSDCKVSIIETTSNEFIQGKKEILIPEEIQKSVEVVPINRCLVNEFEFSNDNYLLEIASSTSKDQKIPQDNDKLVEDLSIIDADVHTLLNIPDISSGSLSFKFDYLNSKYYPSKIGIVNEKTPFVTFERINRYINSFDIKNVPATSQQRKNVDALLLYICMSVFVIFEINMRLYLFFLGLFQEAREYVFTTQPIKYLESHKEKGDDMPDPTDTPPPPLHVDRFTKWKFIGYK